MARRRVDESYFKSAIFGFEDGLVSTTGLVAGLSAGSKDPKFILLGGLVAIGVEAMSMGAGEYLSEHGVHQLKGSQHKDRASLSGFLMSLSFLIAGLIPLTPIIFLPFPLSLYISLIAALVALFLLGVVQAKIARVRGLRGAVEMIVIGGLATVVGFILGLIAKI